MVSLQEQHEIEQFLFHEAQLLDDWQLPEWAQLYTEDALYEVASPNSSNPVEASAATSLFLISDRSNRIHGRASRLMKKSAHAEYPRSKTRHMISNIRVQALDGDGAQLKANFCVFRTKSDHTTLYMGECHYRLRRVDGQWRIVSKRAILDLNSLYEQGRLSIIL